MTTLLLGFVSLTHFFSFSISWWHSGEILSKYVADARSALSIEPSRSPSLSQPSLYPSPSSSHSMLPPERLPRLQPPSAGNRKRPSSSVSTSSRRSKQPRSESSAAASPALSSAPLPGPFDDTDMPPEPVKSCQSLRFDHVFMLMIP